jgi:hypothetical protein
MSSVNSSNLEEDQSMCGKGKYMYTHQYDFSSLNNTDLSSVFKSDEIEKSDVVARLEQHGLIQNKWKRFFVMKYDKKKLQHKDYKTNGLFRSVIHSNGSILAISPPKSIDFDEFALEYPIEECRMDELVEGTMINLFYDHEEKQWEMATKSNIGARTYFFKDYAYKNEDENKNENENENKNENENENAEEERKKQNTFRSLFLDVCEEVQLHFDELPKKYCYSFVFQHPLNRIVTPFTEKRLYVISIFHVCEGNIVKSLDKDTVECKEIFIHSNVEYPKQYNMGSYNNCLYFQNEMKDYKTSGLSIWHTKSGARTKLRNPVYERVRRLRGNQPKMEYRFLELLREKRLEEYMSFYPEKRDELNAYRNKLYTFTNQLYSNYISCYIKHEHQLKDFPIQFRKHMFNLHEHYKTSLKPVKLYINKKTVIDYVNNLHPSVLMYSMNLSLRILKRPEYVK